MNKPRPLVAGSDTPASMEKMGAILKSAGVPLSVLQLRLLWDYHTLLRNRNPELNLTRVHRFSNMVVKLYLDSLLPAVMLDLPSPLLDLGTGPGMPGIPLKIFRPDLEVILAESRQKRVAFLNETIETLGLKGIRVHAGRISSHTEMPVQGVITRAVAPIVETLGRIQNILNRQGKAVFMKGPACDAEVARAVKRYRGRYALLSDKAYTLPGTRHRRRLVVFSRDDTPAYAVRESARTRKTLHVVSSPRNPLFIDLKKLLTGRGVRKASQALVSGTRLVESVFENHPERCAAWISRGEQPPPPASLKWFCLAPGLYDVLDIYGTRGPLLVVRVPAMPVWKPEDGFPEGCTVLLPFQDPENVGAAVRSAVAFGASQGVLLKESAHPFHPKALRASGGAVLDLPLRQGPGLDALPLNIPVLALSAEGRNLHTLRFPKAFGLLAGIEGPGLPDAWRNQAVAIPMAGRIESLNAATALSVVLYEWSRRRGN